MASQATDCDKLTLVTAFDERTIQAADRHIDIVPAYKWLLSPLPY